MTKFLRRTWSRYSKLGKKRKKKQVWRKPKGRDNKMREKRKGYPKLVSIGYGKNKKIRGAIENKKLIIIKEVKDFEKVQKNKMIILGHMGKKKKIEILKKAKEKKIEIYNLNIEKFIKKQEKREKIKKEKSKSKDKKEKKVETKEKEAKK